MVWMECPARCSGGRRPLIAGCLSLRRLGDDFLLCEPNDRQSRLTCNPESNLTNIVSASLLTGTFPARGLLALDPLFARGRVGSPSPIGRPVIDSRWLLSSTHAVLCISYLFLIICSYLFLIMCYLFIFICFLLFAMYFFICFLLFASYLFYLFLIMCYYYLFVSSPAGRPRAWKRPDRALPPLPLQL